MRNTLSTAEGVLGSPIRNLVSILGFVGLVVAAATAAYMAAGWSFTDASYMVLLTIYTVGYGEVHPIDTPYLHAVTVSLMVLGCTGMILLTSALVQLFTILQLRQLLGPNRMQARIEKLDGHVIVCGYGRIGVMLARDLAAAGMPLVVVERNAARLAEAEAEGHLCLAGDATEEHALILAGITRARTLATVLPDDAANVFITLSARSLNPGVEIIARGEAPTTESKLRHAGADHVVLPTHIGAERIARMVLFPQSDGLRGDERFDRAGRQLGEIGLRLERVTVAERSTLGGQTVAEAERLGKGSFFIVQLERAGSLIARPATDDRIEAGDQALIVARNPVVARGIFASRGEIRAGRNTF
ncbi:MAG TPA: potassium channel family protein [Sphingomonas sp.]